MSYLSLPLGTNPSNTENKGQDPILEDGTALWTHSQLMKLTADQKLEWTEMKEIVESFDDKFFCRNDIIVPFDNLSPNCQATLVSVVNIRY